MKYREEKVSFGVRLRDGMTVPGLSFGDSVNLTLFFLTIVSLAVAGVGVYVAVRAMNDAHKIADEQKIDAKRAAQDAHDAAVQARADQEAEFDEQMRQLSNTSASLSVAARLLADERKSLESIEGFAAKSDKLASARPYANVFITCLGVKVIDSEQRSGFKQKVIQTLLFWPGQPFPYINCGAHLKNTGQAVLEKASVKVIVRSSETSCPPSSLEVTTNDGVVFPSDGYFVVHDEDIAPVSRSNESHTYRFDIKPLKQCDSFDVYMYFTSKNVDPIYAHGEISTNPRQRH